jgi:Spx/MgsR family transcriptional regulator
MIYVYGIKNCGSVKKALKFFKENNIAYVFHDFKNDPLGCKHINAWLQKAALLKLFNTRGTTYRTLKLKELDLKDEEKVSWLCKENMLIKRPVIEYDDNVIVGFDLKTYEGEFLS